MCEQFSIDKSINKKTGTTFPSEFFFHTQYIPSLIEMLKLKRVGIYIYYIQDLEKFYVEKFHLVHLVFSRIGYICNSPPPSTVLPQTTQNDSTFLSRSRVQPALLGNISHCFQSRGGWSMLSSIQINCCRSNLEVIQEGGEIQHWNPHPFFAILGVTLCRDFFSLFSFCLNCVNTHTQTHTN